ncbi:MAG: DUF86 domain-containing protein [Leptospiraceae bacterium]|nr:DUF86 domain-containing protein [Leptospiraceae bacterium]
MVNKSILQTKIEHFEEYFSFLEEMKQYSKEEYLQNMMIRGSVERYLQLSIEVTIDIANHIISSEKLGNVHWYQDVAIIFQENGFINQSLCETWIQMIRFRNLLVHEYVKIDHNEVYKILQNNLSDLKEIEKVFIQNFI